jgi:hypothetical protein
VTSLHFYNSDILLAGHGPYLKVYNVKTGRLLCNQEALPHHRIHRIVPGKKEKKMMRLYQCFGIQHVFA